MPRPEGRGDLLATIFRWAGAGPRLRHGARRDREGALARPHPRPPPVDRRRVDLVDRSGLGSSRKRREVGGGNRAEADAPQAARR